MLSLVFAGTIDTPYSVPANADRNELFICCLEDSVNPVSLTDIATNAEFGIKIAPGSTFILSDGGEVVVANPSIGSSKISIWEVT